MGGRSFKRALPWVTAYFASIALMVALQSADGPPLWYAPVAVGVGLLATGGDFRTLYFSAVLALFLKVFDLLKAVQL